MASSKKGFDFIPLVVLAGAGALVYFSGKSGDKEVVKKSSTRPAGATPPPGPRPQTLKPPPKISGSVPAQEAQVESASYSDLQSLGYSISSPVEAIRKFQEDYNTYKSASVLSVDGAWGPKTSAALEDVFASFPDQQSWMQALAPATSAEYDFDRDYALAELGYMESDAAENMYRFQIDYLNHTQQPQTEGLAIYSWSLEWENALRWTYETLRDLWSGLVVQGVTWAEVADQVAAEQAAIAQGTLTVRTDVDINNWNSVKHDHIGIGPRDPRRNFPEQFAAHSLYKDGLTAEDIMLLVQMAADGTLDEPYGDQPTSPRGRPVGRLYTGPMNVVSNAGPKGMINHYHTSEVSEKDIYDLARDRKVILPSSAGRELPPDDGTESHYHQITLTIE